MLVSSFISQTRLFLLSLLNWVGDLQVIPLSSEKRGAVTSANAEWPRTITGAHSARVTDETATGKETVTCQRNPSGTHQHSQVWSIFIMLTTKKQVKDTLWTNTAQISLFFLSFKEKKIVLLSLREAPVFEKNFFFALTHPKLLVYWESVGSEQFGGDIPKQNIKGQTLCCFISLQQYQHLPA